MHVKSFLLVLATLVSLLSATMAPAVTIQVPENILPDGSAFLLLEAEDVFALTTGDGMRGDPEVGYVVVDKNNPIQTVTTAGDPPADVIKGGLDVLGADTNASGGGALFHNLGSGGANTATWQVQFAIPATYYLYMHWSMYNRDANTNYGNEDSFYVPPSFNANSRSDWIDFEGVDEFGDLKFGDSNRDGWIDGFATMVNVVSGGFVETHNSTDEDFWDGQFHWTWINRANDMDENDAFLSFAGHGIQYDVAEEDVGTVLDFQISGREPYGVIDAFIFSTSNTLLDDFTQEEMDAFFLTEDAASELQAGDADQDLDFDQLDIVKVSVAAKYLTGQAATWGDGDWDGAPGGSPGSPPVGNGFFDQGDIVASLQHGLYLAGPYGALASGGGNRDDDQTSLVYDAGTGELSVDPPQGKELTSVNITSAGTKFIGEKPAALDGAFDNFAGDNIFKATFGGSFGAISFGEVLPTGLTQEEVTGDLSAVGSLAGGGDLGEVDLVYIPEPAGLLLVLLGAIGLVTVNRRR